jgi:hypothetical protein
MRDDLKRISEDLKRLRSDIESDMDETTRTHQNTTDLVDRIEALQKRRAAFDRNLSTDKATAAN